MVLDCYSAIIPFHGKPNAQIIVFLNISFHERKEDTLFENGYTTSSSDLEHAMEG